MPISLKVHDTGLPMLTIRNLRVNRGGRPILSDLNCTIARGSITAVVGLNGCGKSTLLRTLVGEFPYEGEVKFACGEDHSKPRPDHVGYVPQRLSIETSLPITVRDLIGLARQRMPIFFGVSSAVIRQMQPVLDRVGVPPRLLDVPIDGLSGGQLQRVMLALALQPQPELLLLDEPSSGIDFKDQEGFNQLLAEINNETGTTILLVSHDLTTLNKFAHRVLCLRNGRIIAEGPPAEVLTPEAIAKTFGPTSIVA
jgi:ABC-type Mn2+/Zn2+ transport system ATPase subunit